MSADKIILVGGCFCGDVRYEFQGRQFLRGLCVCRTCQKFSGGAGNLYMAVEAVGFQFTTGQPVIFTDPNHRWKPIRHFCGTCGVHLTARSERAAAAILIKVGTLDDPSVYDGPQMVTWTSERQKFHCLPVGVPAYAELPTPQR